MPSCDTCKEGPNQCPDVLSTFVALCHEHPSMAECASFFAFCSATGSAFDPICRTSPHKYLPSMKMYFHQRVGDIILWREWIPSTKGALLLAQMLRVT